MVQHAGGVNLAPFCNRSPALRQACPIRTIAFCVSSRDIKNAVRGPANVIVAGAPGTLLELLAIEATEETSAAGKS
jgi:hypothetical protein